MSTYTQHFFSVTGHVYIHQIPNYIFENVEESNDCLQSLYSKSFKIDKETNAWDENPSVISNKMAMLRYLGEKVDPMCSNNVAKTPMNCFSSKRERNAKKDQCHLLIEKKCRQAANKKERNRVRAINEAFWCLQNKLPKVNNKKISRMGTLTSAVEYIRFLSTQLSSSLIGLPEEQRHESRTPHRPNLAINYKCSKYKVKSKLWTPDLAVLN